ncbi:MAG: SurA N-terminal domain-containing protein [Bacteroidales bacterium]|nr:SurA N-terminal domain-containing protein [Bacteroidales bacterium]
MAVLQKIRNKGGVLVIIFVGVALFLFIIDPSTFQQLFSKNETNIAKINGEKVEYSDFQKFYDQHREFLLVAQRKSSLDTEDDNSIREQAWNDILQDYLLKPAYEEVGLSVSDEELEDLLYGSNIHNIILQNFTDNQTGRVDTANIRSFFERAGEDPSYQIIANYWKFVIKRDHVRTKYNNMIAKGFYTPTVFAKMDYQDKNNMFDFEYVFRAYKEIPDENIKISEADFKAYYDEHQYMFVEESKSRDIEYVVFEVKPSAEDTATIKTDIEEMYVEFNALESGYMDYASRYNEIPMQQRFISQNDLPNGLNPEFFDGEIGSTSEIILFDNMFYFTRIAEVAQRPDSVNASHILLIPNDTVTLEQCYAKADSLKALAEAGEEFAILALMNSEDSGSQQQGGSLGWFTDGMMVPAFNEASFTGKTDDISIVESQFGVHIVKINEQSEYSRKIKLATVAKEIRFSDRTSNYYFSKSSNFSADNNTSKSFDDAVIAERLTKRVADKLSELDNKIPGIENARDIVRWVYRDEAQVGDISTVFHFTDKFIVVKIAAIREKGVAPLENVKDIIEPIVLNNLKSEQLIAELNKDISSNMSIGAISEKYGKTLDTITNISFSSFSLPGVGIEPNVNAVVSTIEPNKISQPIKGNNGVFVVKVINKIVAPEKTDFTQEKLSLMRNQASQVYRLFEALEKKANIEDNRARYF